jgi:hypothetical protein
VSAPVAKQAADFLWEDTLPLQTAVDHLRTCNRNTPIDETLDRARTVTIEADKLLLQYRELVDAYEHRGGELRSMSKQLDDANAELVKVGEYLAAVDDDEDDHTLAQLVRYYHDRTHYPQAWAVCPHEMCRRAGRSVA